MEHQGFYLNLALKKIKIGNVSFGLRQIGKGADLVFVHGFPTHGYTWRKLLPDLSQKFKCHIIDLPGLGDSEWSRKTNFNISAQATAIQLLLDQLRIGKYHLIAHNSGGTIARIMAINEPERVENLILINTEIPNHRPPFIELYQKIGLLPFVAFHIRRQLNNRRFIRSSMGFKQAYSDKSMLDDAHNLDPYLKPLVDSKHKAIGAFKYLKGIDWSTIDEFERTHHMIKARILFLWGQDDRTFPIHLGKEMVTQFKTHVEFVAVENASLLPHEEQPDFVLQELIRFLE